MGIRDKELHRLEKYANGLGIRVSWKIHTGKDNNGATWEATDPHNAEIEMFVTKTQTKTDLILNLLHELGHHLSFVYNGRKDNPRLLKALTLENENKPVPKSLRKLIYEGEQKDAGYRLLIAKEVGLKIPEWKIHADIELDEWIYKQYYDTGKFPAFTNIKKMKKEIWRKHRET